MKLAKYDLLAFLQMNPYPAELGYMIFLKTYANDKGTGKKPCFS